MEPPKTTRIERVLGAAEAMFERQLTEATMGSLSAESVGKPEELIIAGDPVSVPGHASAGTPGSEDEGQAGKAASRAFLQELKEDPGAFQLDTLLAALCQVRQAELTDGLVELLVQLVHKIGLHPRDRRGAVGDPLDAHVVPSPNVHSSSLRRSTSGSVTVREAPR